MYRDTGEDFLGKLAHVTKAAEKSMSGCLPGADPGTLAGQLIANLKASELGSPTV